MAYRNKTYVCFDGDHDMHYYRLMCAWKQHEGISFNFYNAHDLNTARDNSQEDSIKRQLRERMKNTSVLVVLIGEQTRYLYKFVRWEMEQAIQMNIPIIAVNLNGQKKTECGHRNICDTCDEKKEEIDSSGEVVDFHCCSYMHVHDCDFINEWIKHRNTTNPN